MQGVFDGVCLQTDGTHRQDLGNGYNLLLYLQQTLNLTVNGYHSWNYSISNIACLSLYNICRKCISLFIRQTWQEKKLRNELIILRYYYKTLRFHEKKHCQNRSFIFSVKKLSLLIIY